MTKVDIAKVLPLQDTLNMVAMLRRNLSATNPNRAKRAMLVYDIEEVYKFIRKMLTHPTISDDNYNSYSRYFDAVKAMKEKGIR